MSYAPATLQKMRQEAVIKIAEMMAQETPINEIIVKVKEEYPTLYLGPRCALMKEAKKHMIMNYTIEGKDYYLKESMHTYDGIMDESERIRDTKEKLKIKLNTLKDRNELLNLSKAGATVEINFNSKNYTDDDFLNDMNMTIDVKPNEVLPVKEEVANEQDITVEPASVVHTEKQEE